MISILGVGNVLMRDEGVGPAVIAYLNERHEFGGGVRAVDCATMGLALLPYFRDSDHIIVVDAVDGTGHPAGTIVRFSPEDIARHPGSHTAHSIAFPDVLDAAALLGYRVKGSCVGVQVADMRPEVFDIGLTPAVAAAVPAAAREVVVMLGELGVEVRTAAG
ncbi:MAG: hydrogenase maturation protease [Coriobacteriales bacterium]|jgi:hydrogenase maturation protease